MLSLFIQFSNSFVFRSVWNLPRVLQTSYSPTVPSSQVLCNRNNTELLMEQLLFPPHSGGQLRWLLTQPSIPSWFSSVIMDGRPSLPRWISTSLKVFHCSYISFSYWIFNFSLLSYIPVSVLSNSLTCKYGLSMRCDHSSFWFLPHTFPSYCYASCHETVSL